MFTQAECKYLNSEQREFTNDRGERIKFYRLNVLDMPELNPITLPCSESVYTRLQAQDPVKLSDMVLYLSVTQRGNAVRVRVEDFTV